MRSRWLYFSIICCFSILLISVLRFKIISDAAKDPLNNQREFPIGKLCTSFGLEQNGFIIHAANVEHETIHRGLIFINPRGMEKWGLDPSRSGEFGHWISKYGSVTFNLVGYQYAENGMNEAGLTVSSMSLKGSESPAVDDRPPLDESLWVQYQLDMHSTIDEVIASKRQVRINVQNSHFLFCDRTGECAVIEFLGGQMVVTRGTNLPVIVLTNTAYQDALRAWQRNDLFDHSMRRFSKAARRLEHYDPNKVDAVGYAFDTLAQVTLPSMNTPPAQWSMVMDRNNLIIYYRTRLNPEIRMVDFSMLDFGCHGLADMLDVDAGPAGDVSSLFEPYSHEYSLDHLNQFFKEWGIEISEEGTKQFLEELERYSCADVIPEPQMPPLPSSEQTNMFVTGVRSGLILTGLGFSVVMFYWTISRGKKRSKTE